VEAPDPIPSIKAGHPVFLMAETHTRTVATQSGDEPLQWRVVMAANGKWNHGAEDTTLLMFTPDNAVAIGTTLVSAAISLIDDLDEEMIDSMAEELQPLIEAFGKTTERMNKENIDTIKRLTGEE